MPEMTRLPDETALAFSAFCVYRQMPPELRSLSGAAQKAGKSINSMRRWSARFDWNARVTEYDTQKEKEVSDIEHAVDVSSAKRHIGQAQRLMSIGMNELERLAVFSAGLEIPLIRPVDAIKMVEVGFKMERLVNGESTEHNEGIIRILKPLTSEEMQKYDKIITSGIGDSVIDVDLG